jgi:apolipoprotein N-acyltransferase
MKTPVEVQSIVWKVLVVVSLGCLDAFAMTYYATTSIPYGWVTHPLCCLAYSLQPLCWFGIWHWSKGLCHSFRIPVVVFAAVLVEYVEARLVTPVWIVTHPALFLVDTPIVQWTNWISTFGLSAFLYLALFSLIPNRQQAGWYRWQGVVASCFIGLALWFGGKWIENQVIIEEMPFSAALVQPNLRHRAGEHWQPWQELARLTDDFLATGNRVDLIVWPENSVASTLRSRLDDQLSRPANSLIESVISASLSEDSMAQFDVAAMVDRYSNTTDASLLVGSLMVDRVEVVKYGLTVPQLRRINCACLWGSGLSGGKGGDCLQVHEKQALMPLREYTPSWMDFDIVRKWIMPGLKSNELTPGENYRTLSFTDSKGIERRLGIAICYESWLPWLPQYHTSEPIDALVHLAYDGDFDSFPVYTQRMLGAIQLRAIETRTWHLVCSTWAGTALIDPRGRIVKQLAAKPGILRTDELRMRK